MRSRSSVANKGCREGHGSPVLEKKVAQQRLEKGTPRVKRNRAREERRRWQRTGIKGAERRIAGFQKLRNQSDLPPEPIKEIGVWVPDTVRGSKPRSGIQRHTPRTVVKNKPLPRCDIESIQQNKARYHARTLQRQIRKVVAFAKRYGIDAEAIQHYLAEKFLNSPTEGTIPVGKYQRLILQNKGAFS